MQSVRLATRLAHRRVHKSSARCLSTSQATLIPNSNPLAKQPVAEPRHSDAFADAPPSPASHDSQTPRYVNAVPDPPNTDYDVPSGPYASAAPYSHTHATESSSPTTDLSASHLSKEDMKAFEPSSSSASPAHPVTTKRVARVALEQHATEEEASCASTEYAESPSSAVRNRSAPGLMRDAKAGGLGIMENEARVSYPESPLPDRNPPPLTEEAEAVSRAGVKEAWKTRK